MILHAKSQFFPRLRRGFLKTFKSEVLTKGKGLQIGQNPLPKFGPRTPLINMSPPLFKRQINKGGGHIEWNTTDVNYNAKIDGFSSL